VQAAANVSKSRADVAADRLMYAEEQPEAGLEICG